MQKKDLFLIKKQLSAKQESLLLTQNSFILESRFIKNISLNIPSINIIKTSKILKQTSIFKSFSCENKNLNSFVYFLLFSNLENLTGYIKILSLKNFQNKNTQLIFIKIKGLFFKNIKSYNEYKFSYFILFIKLNKLQSISKK